MPRFDEVELRNDASNPDAPSPVGILQPAGRLKRLGTFAIDLSLFIALAIAMSPLLPQRATLGRTIETDLPAVLSFASFILLISYYYFVLCWVIWGKTVGGAILEVRVVTESAMPIDFPRASKRWLATMLSLAAAGMGFIPILFPLARTLPDRFSDSVPIQSP